MKYVERVCLTLCCWGLWVWMRDLDMVQVVKDVGVGFWVEWLQRIVTRYVYPEESQFLGAWLTLWMWFCPIIMIWRVDGPAPVAPGHGLGNEVPQNRPSTHGAWAYQEPIGGLGPHRPACQCHGWNIWSLKDLKRAIFIAMDLHFKNFWRKGPCICWALWLLSIPSGLIFHLFPDPGGFHERPSRPVGPDLAPGVPSAAGRDRV